MGNGWFIGLRKEAPWAGWIPVLQALVAEVFKAAWPLLEKAGCSQLQNDCDHADPLTPRLGSRAAREFQAVRPSHKHFHREVPQGRILTATRYRDREWHGEGRLRKLGGHGLEAECWAEEADFVTTEEIPNHHSIPQCKLIFFGSRDQGCTWWQ